MTVNNIYTYVYLCKSAVKEQEWTNIEISQTLMARKYWYRVKYNGEEVGSQLQALVEFDTNTNTNIPIYQYK